MKKDLVGHESTHYVTADGRVFRKAFKANRQHKGKYILQLFKLKELSGVKLCRKGYKRVNIFNKVYLVHRLIALTFIPNPHNKPQVNHINGVKTDNRVSNLEWVTNDENRAHAVKNNLYARGESLSNLTEKQVRAIRKLCAKKIPQKEIAKKYKTTQQIISKIHTRYTWKHI